MFGKIGVKSPVPEKQATFIVVCQSCGESYNVVSVPMPETESLHFENWAVYHAIKGHTSASMFKVRQIVARIAEKVKSQDVAELQKILSEQEVLK